MAILNDLAKETSFRRFYLRWLAACWLPALFVALPFAALAMDMWFRFFRAPSALVPVSNLALPVFWSLVALCQWWFLRPYSSSHRRWMAVIVLAGFAASFALFFVGGLTFTPSTGILFGFLIAASMVTGPFDASFLLMATGGTLFGFILSAALSYSVALSNGVRLLWIMQMTVTGTIVFALLWPLCDALIWSWAMMRFPLHLSLQVAFGGLIGAPTGILLAGWALWSSAAGMVLWWMRALQARRDLAQAQEVFD